MRCVRYWGMEGPLVRIEGIPLLKKGEKGRREMEREPEKEGHRKGVWHMVIVKSLWRGLQEHTVAPGGARAKGHPMLEHPGRGMVRATAQERPGRKAETQRWPPVLEHPGQAVKTGTRAPGTQEHGEGAPQPRPAGEGLRAKEAADEGCIGRRGSEHRG